MTSGWMQLLAWGSQNIKLNGNPSMTFFKKVFRSHTNFSMESIEVKLNRTDANVYTPTLYKVKIPRQGDLVQQMYFVFELPDIVCSNSLCFKWVDNLGEMIIDNYYINLGGAMVDRQYGEQLHINNMLTLGQDKRDVYNKMIGNIPELTNPGYNKGSYPISNTGILPSIRGRKIVVPLQFWFNRDSGSALPLVSMQYSETELTIELQPLIKLYKLFYNRAYLAPDLENPAHRLSAFVSNENKRYLISDTVIDIKASLECNYIFLDQPEREYLVYNPLEYLVEQTTRIQRFSLNENNVFDLILQNPVKEIFWVLRRNDIADYNDWFTFTDDDKQILKSAQILFNGLPRMEEKEGWYYNYLQAFQHHKGNPKDGIYTYSFSIDPENGIDQPSGSCNMSRINKISMVIKTIPSLNKDYKYDMAVYVINYNFVKIVSGLAGIVFSS